MDNVNQILVQEMLCSFVENLNSNMDSMSPDLFECMNNMGGVMRLEPG